MSQGRIVSVECTNWTNVRMALLDPVYTQVSVAYCSETKTWTVSRVLSVEERPKEDPESA